MQTNISLILEACQELNISYEILAPNQNLVRIKLNGEDYYCVNFSMPFNNEQIVHIFKDKEIYLSLTEKQDSNLLKL